MKFLQMQMFIFLLLSLRPSATSQVIVNNKLATVDLAETVKNSCMSIALQQFYSDPSHPSISSCDPSKIGESSGAFWVQGSSIVGGDDVISRTLRIGVPMKNAIPGFMTVKNSSENGVEVTGFPFQVFEEVMAMLPYKVLYEYIPYKPDEGDEGSEGYYDSLISQVYKKEIDAVVGDITVTAKRSDSVDFPFEYMEAGTSMILPVEDDDTSGAWWFLEPLSTELWVITFVFSILKGVLVWFFEHSDNSDFQGRPSDVVGKIIFYSFTTFIFANNEKLKSNYSRFIVSVWTFVVFILVTCYGANVTSILTVERLQSPIKDLNQLLKNGYSVGYQKGSFIHSYLESFGFPESKLKPFSTLEDYEEALSTRRVAAIVDEVPYIRVFLKHHCRKYTMSDWSNRTGGFSFVFPRGSIIAPDISRAILKLREGRMSVIEKEWFGDPTSCTDSENPKRLLLYNLRSIYILAGVASAIALFAFFIHTIYKNKIEGVMDRLMKKGLPESIVAVGRYLRPTGTLLHSSRVAPQTETTVEFNSIDEDTPDVCTIEILNQNYVKKEDYQDDQIQESGPLATHKSYSVLVPPKTMHWTQPRSLSRRRNLNSC